MYVKHDRAVCAEHGICVAEAPDIFDLDDNGSVVLVNAEPGDELREQVESAAAFCPTRAIRLVVDEERR